MIFRLIRMIFIAVFLEVVASIVLLLFTPIPYRLAADRLVLNGPLITGIDGSLMSGLNVGKIVWNDPTSGFSSTIEGVRFEAGSIFDMVKGRFIFENFTIRKMQTKLKKELVAGAKNKINPLAPPEAVVVDAAPPAQTSTTAVPDSVAGKVIAFVNTLPDRLFNGPDAIVKAIGIHELRISDSTVAFPKEDGIYDYTKLNELRINDLIFRPSDRALSMGELAYSDTKKEFGLTGFSLSNSEPKVDQVHAKLKTDLDPDHIRKNLDFNIKVEGGTLKDVQKVKITLNALEGKVRATLGPNLEFFASFFDFSIRDVYAFPFPLTHVNMELVAPNALLLLAGGVSTHGDFKIGNASFTFTDKGFVANSMVGTQTFVLSADPAKKLFTLKSSISQSSQDNLAYLYFNSRYIDLDEVKRMQVDSELAYFDRSVSPMPKTLAKIPPKKSPARAPASIRPNTNDSRYPSRR